KNDIDGAIGAYRDAITIDPNYVQAHVNLGNALAAKPDWQGAIRAYDAGIKIDPKDAMAHYGLGRALAATKNLEGAVRSYRTAIKISPNYAEAHCNLGHVLRDLGNFADALASLRCGHELGLQKPGWAYPSPKWVREAERLVELDAKLPKVLQGESKPGDVPECLQLAWLCLRPYKQLNVAAVRFFRDAFTAEPRGVNDLMARHRYTAACAATRAGRRPGKDGRKLEDAERARLRRQALDWLTAELGAWRQVWEKEPSRVRPFLIKQLQDWQRDVDLAGVRAPAGLARLPEAERPQWQRFWE